jgi:hypothetical protein
METMEALSALDAKRSAEAQMARAATCPPWRHAVFGLLMGGLVAAPAVPLPARFAVLIILLAAIPIIIQSDRKRMGMFINGYRRGKTRIVVFVILAVELSLYGLSVYLGDDLRDRVTPLLLGAVGFAIGIAGSLWWQRVFVSELGA